MEIGSTVTLIYEGKLDDGTVFGYATAEQPMKFQTGMDMVVDGFEREILAMNEVGEKKSFTISEYDAFGEYLEDFTQAIPLEQIPFSVQKGQRVVLSNSEDGNPMQVTVIEVKDGAAVVDLNHPLAGQKLSYDVEILEIEEPPENFVSYAEKQAHLKQQSKLLGGDQGDDFR